MQLDTILSLIDSLQDYSMHGNAFCPSCRCSKIVLLFLLFRHSCNYSCKSPLAVSIIVFYLKKKSIYSANLVVFRHVITTRLSLEDMLCVDLSYLIFRTCLALSKAMMVCMAKDLLAYTAAMAVGVINHKVIYMLTIFIHRMLLLNYRLVTLDRG